MSAETAAVLNKIKSASWVGPKYLYLHNVTKYPEAAKQNEIWSY